MYAPTVKFVQVSRSGRPVKNRTGISRTAPTPNTVPMAALEDTPPPIMRWAAHEYSA
jgi:hypothetical protein